MKGVLDRIEDGRYAVILLEEQQREVMLPVEQLPKGSSVNSWFDIEVEQGEVTAIALDEKTSDEKAKQANSLMEKLKRKRSASKFKRK